MDEWDKDAGLIKALTIMLGRLGAVTFTLQVIRSTCLLTLRAKT